MTQKASSAAAIPADTTGKRSFWRKQLSGWRRSGRSQRAYCARQGLSLSTFQWWARKLRTTEASAATFVPLTLTAPSAGVSAVIEVELRSRTRLRLEGEAALRALDRLVARIR